MTATAPHNDPADRDEARGPDEADDRADGALSLNVLPRRRLRAGLAGLLLLALAVPASVSVVTLIALQSPWRRDHRDGHAESLVGLVAQETGAYPVLGGGTLAQRTLDRAAALPGVLGLAIIDGNGRPVLEAGEDLPADLRTTGAAGKESGTELLRVEPGMLVYRAGLTNVTGGRGSLLIALRDDEAGRALTDGLAALVAGFGAAILLVVPFALWRFRKWTSGLRELHTAIRRLALDKPLRPARVTGSDEVAFLTIAFNDMASRLTLSKRRLLEANATLEQRVADRTEELRIANELLERQNLKLERVTDNALRFTDDVAHEFRTPLTVILQFASLLSDGFGGELTEEQADHLAFITEASRDLSQLVDDFLDSSKLRAGTLRVERDETDARRIIDNVWSMLEARADRSGIRLTRSVDDGLPRVFCDPEKAGRALVNLVTNAIKFTPHGGAVCVGLAADPEGGVRVSVADEGPGLNEQERQSLFRRFRQTHAGRASRSKGFGLGLSIVRELITLNLGEMDVQSEQGKGSTFSFTLPACDTEHVVGRALAAFAGASGAEQVGVLNFEAATPGDTEDLHRLLTEIAYPMDVLLRRSATGLTAFGVTTDVLRWKSRIEHELEEQGIESEQVSISVSGVWPILDAPPRIIEACGGSVAAAA